MDLLNIRKTLAHINSRLPGRPSSKFGASKSVLNYIKFPDRPALKIVKWSVVYLFPFLTCNIFPGLYQGQKKILLLSIFDKKKTSKRSFWGLLVVI